MKALVLATLFVNTSCVPTPASERLEANDDEAGARAPQPCLFGEYYSNVAEQPDLTVSPARKLSLANAAQITPLEQDRILRTIEESAITDVDTWQEALDATDDDAVWVTDMRDSRGRRFAGYKYYGGDNPYGAVFQEGNNKMVAAFHDDYFAWCKVHAPRGK